MSKLKGKKIEYKGIYTKVESKVLVANFCEL